MTPLILCILAAVAIIGLVVYLRQRGYRPAPESASMAGGIAGWISPESQLLQLSPSLSEDAWEERIKQLKSQEPWISNCILDAVYFITQKQNFYLFCLYNPDEHTLLGRIEELKYTFARLIAMSQVIPSQNVEADSDRIAQQFDVLAVPVGEGESIDTVCRDFRSTQGLSARLTIYLPNGMSPL